MDHNLIEFDNEMRVLILTDEWIFRCFCRRDRVRVLPYDDIHGVEGTEQRTLHVRSGGSVDHVTRSYYVRVLYGDRKVLVDRGGSALPRQWERLVALCVGGG
eukprot:gene6703-21329_t